MDERLGLPGARPRDNEERSIARRGGSALGIVQRLEDRGERVARCDTVRPLI
jgi:hypothetical protein